MHMLTRRHDRPESGVFAGLLFLSVGAILLFGNLSLFPVRTLLMQWWPLLLILVGIKHLIIYRGPSAWISAAFWVGTGILFLSSTLGVVSIAVPSLLWPILLIWFGVCTIIGCGSRHGNGVAE